MERAGAPLLRMMRAAWAAADDDAIGRIARITQRVPEAAWSIGFENLLEACIERCRADSSCPPAEDVFAEAALPWLAQMGAQVRKQYLDDIVKIGAACKHVSFPRFASALFSALHRAGLLLVDARDRPSTVGFCGDSILGALGVLLRDPSGASHAAEFMEAMVNNRYGRKYGALTVYNTSVPGLRAALEGLLAARREGELGPAAADELLAALYSVLQGGREFQNVFEIAIAEVLAGGCHHHDLVFFVNVMARSRGSVLSQVVLDLLAASYCRQGDLSRGYAALDCLRAGLPLDGGVARYIEEEAARGNRRLGADLKSPLLQGAVAAARDRSADAKRKLLFPTRPHARPGQFHRCLVAFRASPARTDLAAYQAHQRELLRRMAADGVEPGPRDLMRLLAEVLHAEVSVEAALHCHTWLLKLLKRFQGRGYDLFFQQARVEEVVVLLLRCFLKKAPQFGKETTEVAEAVRSLDMKLSSEAVWYLMRCMQQHWNALAVVALYSEMGSQFAARRQPQHAFVLIESLIALEELEKAEQVIESLRSRRVPVPESLRQKFPVLMLLRLQRSCTPTEAPAVRRSLEYAVKMLSVAPSLLPMSERHLISLAGAENPWVWREARTLLAEQLQSPTPPAGRLWMQRLVAEDWGSHGRGTGPVAVALG